MAALRGQAGGRFVTAVSTAMPKIVPDMGVYAATKDAVRTLMEALRQEYAGRVIAFATEQPRDVEIGHSPFARPYRTDCPTIQRQGACRSGVTAGSLLVGGT